MPVTPYFFFSRSMPSRISFCASSGAAPAQDLHPFAGLEILVVLEEVLDLLQRDVGQVGVRLHLVVALRQLRRRHRDDLLVAAGFVFHEQHADRAHAHDGAGDDGAGVDDQHVAGIAVIGQRVRDEAVVPGVAHRRVEEAVDHQRAGFLVHLVFDRLAANGDFDDDVDVVRRFFPIEIASMRMQGSVVAEVKSRPAAILALSYAGLARQSIVFL